MAEINKDGTRRELTNLNVQMIALGGSIGTGLFLGSGSTINRTGPSILFVYLIVGIFFFFMLRAIGEMMYSDPEQHTFVSFIYHHLGPSLGKFAEWSYWLELTLAAMAELIAIATYVKLWLPSVPSWLIQVVVLAALTLINLNVVKFFGNSETILSGIKVVAIIFLIIVGIYMIATHHENPSGTHASLGNIFDGFSMFPNGFHEFINAFPMVFFAFQGMEFVGITTAETKNPREVFAKSHQPGHRAHPALLHRCFIRHYGNHSLEDDLRTRQSVRSNLFSGRDSGCRFDHQLCRHRCRLFDFEQRHLFNGAPPVSTGTRISQPEDEVFDESFRSRHSRQQRFVFCFSHAVCANSQLF